MQFYFFKTKQQTNQPNEQQTKQLNNQQHKKHQTK